MLVFCGGVMKWENREIQKRSERIIAFTNKDYIFNKNKQKISLKNLFFTKITVIFIMFHVKQCRKRANHHKIGSKNPLYLQLTSKSTLNVVKNGLKKKKLAKSNAF